MMGPPFTRSALSDDNMRLRSSGNRLSRSARLRGLTPPNIKKQQSSPANKRDPVLLGRSRNSSSERKHCEASPRKTVSGRRLSFDSPKKNIQEASSSKIEPTLHMETLQKMLRGESLPQPRLVLKRLRECDLDGLLGGKSPCLNNDQQAHAQTDLPVNPEAKDSLSHPPTPPKPNCTSSNSPPQKSEDITRSTPPTHPECTVTHISTDVETSLQPECTLTHTSTDVTASTQSEDKPTSTPLATNSECNVTSSCDNSSESQIKQPPPSTNSTQPDTTLGHTSTDSIQPEQTDTSASQPASKLTSTDTTNPTSNMAHLSTVVPHSSPRSSQCLLSTPSHPSSNQGPTPIPLQPSHTLSPTQSTTSSLTSMSSSTTQDAPQVTFTSTHPPTSPAPKDTHIPSALQRSPTHAPIRPQTSPIPSARTSHSLGSVLRQPSSVSPSHRPANTLSTYSRPFSTGNTRMASNPIPRASPLFRPVNSLSRLPNTYTPRPLPRLIRQQMSSPLRSPTHLVPKPVRYQTPANALSRPPVTPTKPGSTLTKTPIPRSPGSSDFQTPTKPASLLTKTPIPTRPSNSTNSLTSPKQSPTPTRPVSTARNPAPGSACTPRPIHPFFQPRPRPVPPLRQLAPSPPSRPPDAKQPCVVSSSSSVPAANTPDKYVQRAFMKCSEEGVLMLKGKRSPRVPPSRVPPPPVPLSEPSPSSSSSASSSLSAPPVAGKNTARKLFSEADSQPCPEDTVMSSSPPSSPVNPQQPSPAPSVADPPGDGPVLTLPPSQSPPMDNLDEILTPDSLPTSVAMDVDTASPEPSQDSSSLSPPHTGTMVTEPADTTVTASVAEKVLEEPGHAQTDIRVVKVEPNANSFVDLFRQPPAPPCQASPGRSPEVVWIDPLDDLGFDTGLDCALSDTSSSEEEQLLSLQEIMERSVRPPPTPDKEAFSEPSTPVRVKRPVEPIKVKTVHYNNTLDQMLIERKQNEKTKELEEELLRGCREDLLTMEEEEEEVDGEKVEEISQEQHKFVQRYTLTASTIRDLHPGEELFSLANFGRLFTQDGLHLPQGLTSQNTAQRCLLRASPKQALLLVQAGLLKMAYASSPCQPEVSRWLLQMMSVHSNPCMSAQILHSLKHLALIAGLKIAECQDPQFQVWVPSVQDVVLVFLNMGVPFINMFPLEMLQPSFTEADLLGSTVIGPEGSSSGSEHTTFPEHNFDNVIKYLSVCAALCPRAYSDQELVLLLALVCRLSLDTHLQLLPTASLSNLMLHLINNITDWDTQMPLVCQTLTDLTDDHHNLRRLVQLLPPNTRGRALRRHLSLSIISKLLNHRCTYKPASTEFKLSDLRRYVPRMTPSVLKKHISGRAQEQDETTLDQQAYYLCYSLLDLTNEASNYEFLRPDQKNQLKLLSAQLEKHVKCDIRESEKCLYRSKVKDYVARIYTRWQVLLQRTRPAQGKLYDFWEPLSEDALSSSQEEQQDHRRLHTHTEVQQNQGWSQLHQEQRRPQAEGQQKHGGGKEPEENLVPDEPEDMAAGDCEAAEEMRDDSSGDETVVEEATMMEEQSPEKQEPNGERNLLKENEVDKTEEHPVGGEGLALQEEELHGEEETNKKTLETDQGLDRGEEHTAEGKEEQETRGETALMEDKELAMEEDSGREDRQTTKQSPVKDKVLSIEEESPRANGRLVKEAQVEVEESEMEVELPEEQGGVQAMEVRVEAVEQQLTSREGVQAEEVEMKEMDSESPEQDRPNTEVPMAEGETQVVPMAEGETQAGERSESVGEKVLDSEMSGN